MVATRKRRKPVRTAETINPNTFVPLSKRGYGLTERNPATLPVTESGKPRGGPYESIHENREGTARARRMLTYARTTGAKHYA